MQRLTAAWTFCFVLSTYSLKPLMRLDVSLGPLQQHLWNSLVHCSFPHGKIRSLHILQDDFAFINYLPTSLQLDSAIRLVLYLVLTLLISRNVWTSTFIQMLTPLITQLMQAHKWEWRRQEKPHWYRDTWRWHFFPVSNWQGSVILEGLFLPAPSIIITVAGNKK